MAKKTTYSDIEPDKRFILPSHIKGKKYYLYAHLRNDNNEIFYFGIGTMDKGKNYYRALCHKKRNIIWKRIVNKTSYTIIVFDESDIKQEILDKEIQYIKLIGKKKNKSGTLANITDGGEGLSGYKIIWTEEMRKCASERLKNRKIKESTREKLRNNIYNSNLIGRKGKDSYIAKAVLQVDIKTNKTIEEYPTIKEASIAMNVSSQSISAACKKGFKTKGYIWRLRDGK